MLTIKNLHTQYGKVEVLRDVSLEVKQGEIVAVIGANGAGKSTLLRTISGLIRPTQGSIHFLGKRIDRLAPEEIVKLGVVHIPEGRKIFPRSTTMENLLVGAYTRKDTSAIKEDADQFLRRFPLLRARRNELAKLLSGGEQQMLSISRGLMARPKLLLMDEPSLGLAPTLVTEIFSTIQRLHAEGVSILLVEQNAAKALKIADRAYVFVTGRIALQGTGQELLNNDDVRRLYLGEYD